MERVGYQVWIKAGQPAEYGPKVGWDTVWSAPADAEACAARARNQAGWSAKVVRVLDDAPMYELLGPRQADGGVRYLGWYNRRERDEARKAVRQDPAMWGGLGPDAIIDIDARTGRAHFVRGLPGACAALARAVREDGVGPE